MGDNGTFSLDDVVANGFEASCVTRDGTIYFWHGNYGVRIERRTSKMTLLTDPKALPDGVWRSTKLGAKELALYGPTAAGAR